MRDRLQVCQRVSDVGQQLELPPKFVRKTHSTKKIQQLADLQIISVRHYSVSCLDRQA